jgi:hypothetical protein
MAPQSYAKNIKSINGGSHPAIPMSDNEERPPVREPPTEEEVIRVMNDLADECDNENTMFISKLQEMAEKKLAYEQSKKELRVAHENAKKQVVETVKRMEPILQSMNAARPQGQMIGDRTWLKERFENIKKMQVLIVETWKMEME